MVTRRKFAAGALYTPVMASGLTGWNTAPALAQDSDIAEISVWFDVSGGADSANCTVEQVTEPFNESTDSIHVEAVMQPNGWDATRTALAGGGGPDVVETPGPSHAILLADAGQLAPLDDYIQQYGWSERFVPWALELGRVGGSLYSLPSEQETMLLYNNATLFEERGWTLPTTFDELVQLSEQIASEGVIPFAHGNQDWRGINLWYVSEFLNQVAGAEKMYDFLTGNARLTDPEFVAAVHYLNEFQQNGWFMGSIENYYTSGSNTVNAALGNGDAAMSINGTWFMDEVEAYFGEGANNSNDWAWIPVPSSSGETIFSLGIGSTYSINASSEYRDAAAEYLNYEFSPETQARLVTGCGSAPAPVDMEGQSLEGIDPRQGEAIRALNEAAQAGNYGYTLWTFFAPKLVPHLNDNIERVWSGDMSVEDYLERAQQLHEEDAAAGLLPPVPPRQSSEPVAEGTGATPDATPAQ